MTTEGTAGAQPRQTSTTPSPSVRAGLLEVAQRWAPDEVMAMTDLPDPEATIRSHIGLAEVTAEI